MEFIDIYNENHKYLGTREKGLAHKLGLLHEVFNGIIVNKENKSIIFQIKNAKHNQVHKMTVLFKIWHNYKHRKMEETMGKIEKEVKSIKYRNRTIKKEIRKSRSSFKK